jgi:SAM-dependent MidA family methyltransferase
MERALYDPERGFYSRRAARADFYTAPELHPAFGAVLARRVEQLSAQLGLDSARVVEMGAGEGLLAEQMLLNLPEGTPYLLVERSKPALETALRRLLPNFPQVEGVSSLDELAPFEGILLSNELVDAFPVHVLQKKDGEIKELFIGESGEEVLSQLSTPELLPHASKVAETLEEGARHSVNLEMDRWLKKVSTLLTHGAVLTIDYGAKLQSAPNPPRGFVKHAQAAAIAARPGEQDITSNVDFGHLIALGETLGMRTDFYGTMSRFLIDGGISDFMPSGDSVADVKSRSQVKTLLHPEGMGEVFKVLIQTVRKGMLS